MELNEKRLLNQTGCGAVIGAVLGGGATFAMQNRVKNKPDEFVASSENNKTKSFFEGIVGADFEENLENVAKNKKYEYKTIFKNAGKAALSWAFWMGAIELVIQVYQNTQKK